MSFCQYDVVTLSGQCVTVASVPLWSNVCLEHNLNKNIFLGLPWTFFNCLKVYILFLKSTRWWSYKIWQQFVIGYHACVHLHIYLHLVSGWQHRKWEKTREKNHVQNMQDIASDHRNIANDYILVAKSLLNLVTISPIFYNKI